MNKIVCLFVLVALVAQSCARPEGAADTENAVKGAADDASKTAAGGASGLGKAAQDSAGMAGQAAAGAENQAKNCAKPGLIGGFLEPIIKGVDSTVKDATDAGAQSAKNLLDFIRL